ncbi:MAG: PEP-utilizing enzyme, partial [Anaerolineaceae bacterium]
EPSVQQALRQVLDDPRLLPERQGIRLQTRMRLARFLFPLGYNMIRNWLTPEKRREVILMRSEDLLVRLQMRNAAISGDRFEKLAQLSALLPALVEEKLPAVFIRFVSGVAAGMASLNLLNVLSKDHFPSNAAGNGWHDRVMEVTRGLPNNPTTEMDLALWKVAQSIRHDAESSAAFEARTNAELARQYLDGELPETAQRVLTAFLTQYGARGFCEIDAGRVRWREDPEHVIEVLRGYLQITSEDRAPDRVFQRSAEQAQDAVEALVAGVRSSRRGWLKIHLVRLAASRVRALLGMRESPKFFMVRMMGIERESLLACGREFAAAGELDQPDDLVYLSLTELQRFAARETFDWRGLIAQRRAAYQREFQRRQIPRLLLSDGRAYYGGMGVQPGDEANATLIGSPVSPGSVEGAVRVVFDPRQAHLLPGEILVCPGTDPSWTPLFLTAAGLVMEVGGMMTHGAVVAREYGIPAIVGVDRATRRLKTGQRVRVDGSSGQIILLP